MFSSLSRNPLGKDFRVMRADGGTETMASPGWKRLRKVNREQACYTFMLLVAFIPSPFPVIAVGITLSIKQP